MRKISAMLLCLIPIALCHAEATCEPNIPADVTGDCRVDSNDFVLIASDWLKPAVPHEWLARYNGPGNFRDIARGMAIDGSSNVYVTGESDGLATDYDYATIKYDSNGNEVWTTRYNGPGNYSDRALDVAVDNASNVYVTGSSDGLRTDYDYATIKYDSNGNEVWVARYNGPGDAGDGARAISVDDAGNVYVTGGSWSFSTNGDYATIKYDFDGNEVWVARYNGPSDDYDSGSAIAIDGAGNVYVTGNSQRSPTIHDCTTIKYDCNGNEIWVARYEGAGGEAKGHAVAVDSAGNVYVAGESGGYSTSYDIAYITIKYDLSGDEVWVASYDGPGNSWDNPTGMTIDQAGNVYVTGRSVGGRANFDYATVKYDPNGNELWVARYSGPGDGWDSATGIAVDAAGNVYVAGASQGGGTNYDLTTIKYDANGNPIWLARYNGPANGPDGAADIAIDEFGNIYVTGDSEGSGTDRDFVTTKYSLDYSCTPEVTGDFNHDCKVDFADLRTFCQHWLECNLDPLEACWE